MWRRWLNMTHVPSIKGVMISIERHLGGNTKASQRPRRPSQRSVKRMAWHRAPFHLALLTSGSRGIVARLASQKLKVLTVPGGRGRKIAIFPFPAGGIPR